MPYPFAVITSYELRASSLDPAGEDQGPSVIAEAPVPDAASMDLNGIDEDPPASEFQASMTNPNIPSLNPGDDPNDPLGEDRTTMFIPTDQGR